MVSIGGCRVFFASSTISFWSINSKILLAQARAFCNSTITELSSLNGFENWEAYDKRVDKLPIVIDELITCSDPKTAITAYVSALISLVEGLVNDEKKMAFLLVCASEFEILSKSFCDCFWRLKLIISF